MLSRQDKAEEHTFEWQNGQLVEIENSSKLPVDHVKKWLEKNRKVGDTFSIENLVEGLKDIKPPISRDQIDRALTSNRNNLLEKGLVERTTKGLYRWKGK